MNLSYGGAAAEMYNTKIYEVGPYPFSRSVDNIQNMTFTARDSGPFWMDNIQKISTKYDKILCGSEKKTKQKHNYS